MRVGMIGTGVMGKPMAQNILKAGHPLTIYARSPEKIKDLIESGADQVESAADLAASSQAIVLSLPADPEVEEIVLGENGILDGAGSSTVIIDTTSGTPQSAKRVARACEKKQIVYLDAPVSGGVKGAREGTLTLMVGGDPKEISRIRPLLHAVGRNIYEVGPVGAGRTLKALNQVMAGLNLAVLCESLTIAKKAGISPEMFLEVLGKSAGNSYQLETKLPQFIIPRKFDGGFRIGLMLKDLDIALEMARQLQAPALLASLGGQLYRAAAAAGYSQNDTSSMVQFLARLSGTEF